MKTARIYAFGDSTVAGVYDSQGGWCDRLKRDMHRITTEATDGTKRQMYNLGIGGETSKELAARIKPELTARHTPDWPAVVIICIGKNDSRMVDGRPETTSEAYEQNLRSIIRDAQQFTDKILLVGLGPCAEEELAFKQYLYSRARLTAYNTIASNVAVDLGITKVEIYDLLARSDKRTFYRDDLHPNDTGYQIMYEAIKPALRNLLAQ